MSADKWTALVLNLALLSLAVFLFIRINARMKAELGPDAPVVTLLASILQWTFLLMIISTTALDVWRNPASTALILLLLSALPFCLITAVRLRKHTEKSRFHKGIFVSVVYFPLALAALIAFIALAYRYLAHTTSVPQ